MAQFFQKVMNYVVNNLLVEGLANNSAFQRFALSTNKMYKDAVKSAEPLAKEQMAKAEQFTKAFQENLSKEMEQVMKNNQKMGGGGGGSSGPPRT